MLNFVKNLFNKDHDLTIEEILTPPVGNGTSAPRHYALAHNIRVARQNLAQAERWLEEAMADRLTAVAEAAASHVPGAQYMASIRANDDSGYTVTVSNQHGLNIERYDLLESDFEDAGAVMEAVHETEELKGVPTDHVD